MDKTTHHDVDETAGTERLSADDLAAQRDAQFRDHAVRQVRAAAAAPGHRRGVCLNCRQQCLPAALYCDDDCQADHEHRQRLQRQAGRAVF